MSNAAIDLTHFTDFQEAKTDFFLACAHNSNDAIMLTDLGGVIIYVNPAWSRIFGYAQQEAIGKTPRLLRSGHHNNAFYSSMWKDILNPDKNHWNGEIVNRRKDATDVPVLLTINPIRGSGGKILGYLSFAVDITDRKKQEAQLRWKDRLATIGTLTSGLAHELGTPLGIARGRAEYLMRNFTPGSSEHKSLEAIVSQIDRVSSSMELLLNLSRRNPADSRYSVTLAKSVNDTFGLLRGHLELSGIHWEAHIPDDIRVLAEAVYLEHVLLNLCMNAIDAIQESRKDNGRITVSAEVDRDKVKLFISDNGGGIDPNLMTMLFKPFFTTKDVGKGTGLGLSVTHQTIVGWGGTIDIDNRPGVGLTVELTLCRG